MTRVWTWTTMGFVLLLFGTGASTGLLLDGNNGNEPTEERVSQDKVPGPAISLEPSPSDSPKAKSVKKKKKASEPSSSKSKPADDDSDGSDSSPSNPLPAAFRSVVDPMGFSLSVRKGWQRTALSQNLAQYAPGNGLEVLRVGAMPGAQTSSYNSFAAAEQQLASNDASYRRVTLAQNTFAGQPGALWEFTWTNGSTGEVMRAREQGYVAADGTEYTIYFEARNGTWNAQRDQTFSTAVNTWSVTGPAPAPATPAPASSAPTTTDSGSNGEASTDSTYAQNQGARVDGEGQTPQ